MEPLVCPTQKPPRSPCLNVPMEGLLHRPDRVHHQPLEIELLSSHSLFPEVRVGGPGGGEFQPSPHALVFLVAIPILKPTRGPQPPVISLTDHGALSQGMLQKVGREGDRSSL